ncbi:MAG: hypothetical protein NC388_00525 [Clostridium sp.]|nr:hypothetical protein [Clostridium sp.]
MKKMEYMAPLTEVHNVELENMIALSMIGGADASQDGEVLGVDEDHAWNIWNNNK